MTTQAPRTPLLEMRDITKSFPGVRALDGVTFDLYAGEVHALVGENGAGKSTLMKVLGGVYPHGSYGGEVLIDGRGAALRQRARGGRRGHRRHLSGAVAHQRAERRREHLPRARAAPLRRHPLGGAVQPRAETSRRPAPRRSTRARRSATSASASSSSSRSPRRSRRRRASSSSTSRPPRSTDAEVETLFGILDRLRARGVGMVYISHKLDEVFRLSDRITVLRDGRTVGTDATKDARRGARHRADGRAARSADIFPEAAHERGEVVFEVRGMTVEDPNVRGQDARQGRQLRGAARRGARRRGADGRGAQRAADGRLRRVAGARRAARSTSRASASRSGARRTRSRHGIGFVTEDRKRFGLVLDQTILNNMTLAGLRQAVGALRHRR